MTSFPSASTSPASPASPVSLASSGSPRASEESRGLLVAFEGGDGAGKSTQAHLLVEALRSLGHTVLLTREPGGTEIGEKLRSLVLDHGHGEIDARTEALIFSAARAAHVAQAIRPALARGEIVVTDRYIGSSVVYQGVGRGLGPDEVRDLNLWATEGLLPGLTVVLDVAAEEGRSRRTAEAAGEDRLESEPNSFHSRVRRAFLDLAAERPGAHLVLDAALPVEELAATILDAVSERLGAAQDSR